MSWKLAKRLKGTRSGGRASVAEETEDGRVPSGSDTSHLNLADTIATSEPPSQIPIVKASKPGILVVTLHEACNLSAPDRSQQAFTAQRPTNYHPPGSTSSPSRNSITSGVAGSVQTPSTRPPASAPHNPGLLASSSGCSESSKRTPYALLDFDKQQVFVNSIDGSPESPRWAGSSTQYKFDVSRVAELAVHLFLRKPNANRAEDIPLGVVRLSPRLENDAEPAPSAKGNEKASGFSGIGWVDVQHGTGKLRIGVQFVETQPGKLSVDDFDLLKIVGKGSFGKVMQVRKKDTKRIYALKSIQKAMIISRREVSHTLAERSVLAQINNPFIISLKFSFQSPEKLYFGLDFINGGELFHHLSKAGRFDVNRSRFYAAELLCALECLHGFHVIYRDLKPENILLDCQGHIALCDFGLCKLDMKDEDRTDTFCGTPEYLAPELLMGSSYNKTVDWWTLGILLYEMLTGLPPFYDENVNAMYRRILTHPLHFPDNLDVVPPVARDLLSKLLNKNPAQRLGANGSTEIKSDPFFSDIDWRKLLERKYEPAFKPNVTGSSDTSHISQEFTSEQPKDSPVDAPALSSTAQNQFVGFSYRPVAELNSPAGASVSPPHRLP